MKKLIGLIIIVILFMLINKNDEIRVRIIANSNSEEDLEIKSEIKNKVELFINLCDDDYETYINENIDYLNGELNKISKCSVSFEKHIFMNKAYNDISLQNEEYMTLLVVIGEGLGDNWWTTLYPLNDLNPTTIKYKSWIIERIEND